MRILVIDDSPTVYAAIRMLLVPEGHEVNYLSRFVDLPQTMRVSPPDVVILDLEMPALSGQRVGQYVRKYETKSTPIIVHSSRPENDLASAAEEVGAATWVQKSNDKSPLLNAVRLLETKMQTARV